MKQAHKKLKINLNVTLQLSLFLILTKITKFKIPKSINIFIKYF